MQIEITGLTHAGEGVGRHQGMVCFVPFTVPGDVVEVEIVKQERRFSHAKLISVLKPSSDRILPVCSLTGICGGCNLQHLTYPAQLKWKRQLVEDAIQRIGGLPDVDILPVLGMESPEYYRNKATFHVGFDPLSIGFYRSSSHTIAPIGQCQLIPPHWIDILKYIEDRLSHMNETVRDLKQVMIRQSKYNGEIMLTLGSTIFLKGRRWKRFGEELGTVFQDIKTVTSLSRTGEETVLAGEGFLLERLGGLLFRISPQDFFQVNTEMAEVLVEKVLEFSKLKDTDTVIDGYCGIGTFSLPIAKHAARIIGIEQNPVAVKDAIENATLNGVGNIEFLAGDVNRILQGLATEELKVDLMVIDPPRSGVDRNVLESLLKICPERVVYISCHPAALARDLSHLVKSGAYRITCIQPIDLFPHTPHVETVVLMSRVKE